MEEQGPPGARSDEDGGSPTRPPDPDRAPMKLLLALPLLVLLAFSGFGFLASFEPGEGAIAFRVGYAVLGMLCVSGLVALVGGGRPGKGRPRA